MIGSLTTAHEETLMSRPVLTDHDMLLEVHARTRRIETRMTRYMEQQGFDAEGRKPTWRVASHSVEVPSTEAKLSDILAAVPNGVTEFDITLKERTLMHIKNPSTR